MGRMPPRGRVTVGSCSVNLFLEVEVKSKRFACQVLAGNINNSFPSSPSLLPKSPAKVWEEQNFSSPAHLAGLAHTRAAARQRFGHCLLRAGLGLLARTTSNSPQQAEGISWEGNHHRQQKCRRYPPTVSPADPTRHPVAPGKVGGCAVNYFFCF